MTWQAISAHTHLSLALKLEQVAREGVTGGGAASGGMTGGGAISGGMTGGGAASGGVTGGGAASALMSSPQSDPRARRGRASARGNTSPALYWRKLKLEARFESNLS